jgi:hypothetical protein
MPRWAWLFFSLLTVSGCSAEKGLVATVSAAQLPDARRDALALAETVIRATNGSRLTAFLTWHTRSEIDCSASPSPARGSIRAEARRGLHAFRDRGDAAVTGATFGGFGFYYNQDAENRVCQPAVRGLISQNLKDPGVWRTWAMMHDGPLMVDAYPPGSRVAVAMWDRVAWSDIAARNPLQKIVQLRTASGGVTQRNIKLKVPQSIMTSPPRCSNPLRTPVTPGSGSGQTELKSFYWVQIESADTTTLGSCGDFLVLVGFHLVERKRDRWLWSTFWWDPEAPASFRTSGLDTSQAAGADRTAWLNYAMDAKYGTDDIIFNPWKEKPDSNCETCHRASIVPVPPTLPEGRGTPRGLPDPGLSFDMLFVGQRAQRRP